MHAHGSTSSFVFFIWKNDEASAIALLEMMADVLWDGLTRWLLLVFATDEDEVKYGDNEQRSIVICY